MEYQMASCCRVPVSGDYLVKQKGGKKGLIRRWQTVAPEACVLQAEMVQLGCRWFAAYPAGLAKEMGFGGNTVLNLAF